MKRFTSAGQAQWFLSAHDQNKNRSTSSAAITFPPSNIEPAYWRVFQTWAEVIGVAARA